MLGIWSQVPTLGQQEFLQWTISQVPPPLCRLVDWVIDWLVGGWLSVGQTTTCGVSSPRSPLPTFHHGLWELNSHHLAWLLAPLPAELSHWPLFSLLTFFFFVVFCFWGCEVVLFLDLERTLVFRLGRCTLVTGLSSRPGRRSFPLPFWTLDPLGQMTWLAWSWIPAAESCCL